MPVNSADMSRRPRCNLPGGFFHLTARIQGKVELFTPDVRTGVVSLLRESLSASDAQLFAYTVMPNHLHLVVRQGRNPLGRLMQPLLRRVALLVQRVHQVEGHVFERRFRDLACEHTQHLRNAIIYAHLNPCRARMCADPAEYAWSSHRAYIGASLSGDMGIGEVDLALPLFATRQNSSIQQLREDYAAAVSWRLARDRDDDSAAPNSIHGEVYGWSVLGIGRGLMPSASGERKERADLAHIAEVVIAESDEPHDPAVVRSRRGQRSYVELREKIIQRASAAGYTGVQIANYLRISPATVCRLLSRAQCRLAK